MAENIEELRAEVAESQSFDVDGYQFPPGVPIALQESLKADFKLSQELQRMMLDLAEKVAAGEQSMTWEDLQNAVNKLVEERRGTPYGMPLPSMYHIDRPMILARGVPLHHLPPPARTELEESISKKVKVRNSWSALGDMDVCVIDTEDGPMVLPRYHAGWRLQKLMDTAVLRAGTSQSAESEMRALELLKTKVNHRQWEAYVLGGLFPEKSERSDLHYFFRKGLPTLAVSYHEGIKEGFKGGRVLCALCLHPMGYYQGSYCGMMCPTDEVICHLLMMRGDEHKYWAQCGQWSASDPRSGI